MASGCEALDDTLPNYNQEGLKERERANCSSAVRVYANRVSNSVLYSTQTSFKFKWERERECGSELQQELQYTLPKTVIAKHNRGDERKSESERTNRVR